MRARPVIIAALPREVKALVRGWQEHRLAGKIVVYASEQAIVACAGMGAGRATLAVQAAMAFAPVAGLISAGLAGACDPALKVGDIVRGGLVVDTRSGERFAYSEYRQVLASSPEIASVQEKRRLRATYGASAVDMEAAAVARLAQGHGLPFQAIKAISDDAYFELQQLGRFATADGQFREAAFAAYAAVHPAIWGSLGVLAGNTRRALAALTNELSSQINWYEQRG